MSKRALSVCTSRRAVVFVLVALGLLGGCSGDADESESSVSTSSSRAATATTMPAPGMAQGTATWAVDLETGVAPTPPAVSGDTVVVGDATGVLRAFDRDGALRWERQLDETNGEALHEAWTPVIIDGIVVTGGKTGSGADRPGIAVGVDLDDGSTSWRLEDLEDRPETIMLQRVIASDRLAVTVLEDVVYAIDPFSGRPRWTTPLGSGPSSYFKAWAMDDLVVVSRTTRGFNTWAGTGSYTVALDPVSGVERWRLPEGTVALASLDDGTLVHVLPVPFASQEPRPLAGIDPANGARRWSTDGPLGRNFYGLAVSGRTIVTVAGNEVAAFGSGPGAEVLWRDQDDLGRVTTQPVVIDGAVVVAGQRNSDDVAFVRAYDLTDGTVRSEWTGTAGSPVALSIFGDDNLTLAIDPVDDALAGTLVAVRLGLEPAPGATPALLGIPTPTEALTAKNALYAAGILALLMALVAVPTTLFNTALEHHLHLLQRFHVLRRGRRSSIAADVVPMAASRSAPRAWAPVAAYTLAGAVVFSALEPEWGANTATAVTAASFWAVLVLLIALEIAITARHERVRYAMSTGRPVLSFATLVFAALCVGGSRAIAFVPGFLYGVIVGYRTETNFSDRDDADIARLNVGVVFLLAIAAWVALGPLKEVFGTSGLGSLPTGIAAGIFLGGVETVLIGLLPLRLLPGAALRRHHPIFWKALWAMSGFLFVLALLRPGLASGHSRSTGWILVGAFVYGAVAVVFWWLTTRRAARATSGARFAPTDKDLVDREMNVAP